VRIGIADQVEKILGTEARGEPVSTMSITPAS
jgi:hypothetical protein